MNHLLRIDASSRNDASQSRALGDAFESAWRQSNPKLTVVHRDLVAHPVGHISEVTITGFYTPEEALDDTLREATAMSDALIGEVNGADTILIATPMYNFSIPSALKAWIDQIVRINKTFAYDGTSFAGLVEAKRVVVVSAFGAAGYGDSLASANFVTPYLKFLFNFLGVTDVTVITAEATTADAATVARNIDSARKTILQLAVAA